MASSRACCLACVRAALAAGVAAWSADVEEVVAAERRFLNRKSSIGENLVKRREAGMEKGLHDGREILNLSVFGM
jgi:hypothetical protein